MRMTGRSDHCKGAAGFSLVELVIVMAILAVTAAIAVPRYASAVERYRADAAARQIVAELTRARALARQTSAPQRVQFDLAGHRLLLPDQPASDGSGAARVVRLDRNPYRATLRRVGFDGSDEVSFDGYGVPASGGAIALEIGPTQRTITLHAVSGQASVE